jgi:hypothetical protein
MKQNLQTIEGALYKLKLNINNIGIDEISVYGFCSAYGCSKCVHFEASQGEDNSYLLVVPALNSGLYKYQVFIKNNGTKQEFLVLEGEIIVTDRLCDCNEDIALSPSYSTADVTVSAESIDISMSIEKGMQGDKGDKGDKGDQGFSAYEIAVQNGYKGTEKEWVEAFEGAQEAAAQSKQSAEMAEYYNNGALTHYTNTVAEALNAEQSANNANKAYESAEQQATNAKQSADEAESLLNQTKTERQTAQTAATNATQSAQTAKTYSDKSQTEATKAAQSATAAEEQAMNAESYVGNALTAASAANVSARAAAKSASEAAESASSAATNANKLGNAAMKNMSNTFSGTNTFNNVTKVTVAPNSLTSVMNEEASLLLDFVQQAGIRTVNSTLTQKAGGGTTSEGAKHILFLCPKGNNVSLWQGTSRPFYTSNYFTWSAIWVPAYTNINQKTNYNTGCKYRFIPSFTTNTSQATEEGALDIKLLKQVTDINKPFVNYTNVSCVGHCAVVEFFCEIVDKKFKWTIYSPVDSGGKVKQVKVITFTTASGGGNYTNDTGFLFVNAGNNKAKIFFRDFVSSFYKWQYCGEVYMRPGMYNGTGYTTGVYYAGAGGDSDFYMYLPKEITFLPQWGNPLNFTNCQQILQSVTATDMTETIITLDEYKALQA